MAAGAQENLTGRGDRPADAVYDPGGGGTVDGGREEQHHHSS